MMRTAIVALKGKRASRGQHSGLLLQRYLAENATGDDANPVERREILQAAINAASSQDVRTLYKSAFVRWSASLPTDSPPVDLEIAGRMIVGLGSENVLETGIRLHHTFGMPIIPGSALKGLAAHYCDHIWGLADAKFRKPTKEEDEGYRKYLKGIGPKPEDNLHRLLFGTTDDSGCIVFHDAWYVPNSASKPLALDVMTPHHPNWLDGSVPPSDFDSPIPVPFLSVAGRFRIAVTWNGPEHGDVEHWKKLALSLLKQALAEWGIGGKTSSGYGRLVDPPMPKTESLAQPDTSIAPPELPKPGVTVEAVLVDEKTKKGGWKAEHEPSGLSGPIQNSADVPGDKKAGDRVGLIVASANEREIAFRYPTAADEERALRSVNKPKSDQSSRQKRGRR
jgi:CRISPR-associated protein Cmr6